MMDFVKPILTVYAVLLVLSCLMMTAGYFLISANCFLKVEHMSQDTCRQHAITSFNTELPDSTIQIILKHDRPFYGGEKRLWLRNLTHSMDSFCVRFYPEKTI